MVASVLNAWLLSLIPAVLTIVIRLFLIRPDAL
jgi:hypothetical protein